MKWVRRAVRGVVARTRACHYLSQRGARALRPRPPDLLLLIASQPLLQARPTLTEREA